MPDTPNSDNWRVSTVPPGTKVEVGAVGGMGAHVNEPVPSGCDAVAHTQSIVAEMDRRAARIAELEQQVSVGYESIAMMSGKMRDMKDRILALEAENVRLHQIIESSIPVVDMSDLSVGVPSQVVRIEPTPLAPPINKIATFPRNSPANGVDEQ